MLLQIAIEKRESSGFPNEDEGFFIGLIAMIQDVSSGQYVDEDGRPLVVELDPPEKSAIRDAIALTSETFVGHVRELGYQGQARRVVDVSKKGGTGSTSLDSYRKVTVVWTGR